MASVVTLPKTLPLLEGILIPGSTLRIPVESSQDVELVRRCINEDYSNVIFGVCATQPNVLGEPGAAVHPIGTAGVVVSMQINGGNWPQASYTLYITGVCRFQVKKLSAAHPYRMVDVTQLDRFGGEADDDDPEVQTLVESFREDVRRMVKLMDATVPPVAKLKRMLDTLPGAHLTDLSASVVMLSNADKLRILDTLDVAKRVNILRPLVSQYIKNLQLNQSSLRKSSNQPSITVVRLRIPSQPMSNRQDNWISLARKKQEELGDDLEELQNKLDNSQLPTHAYNVASKELQRLQRMSALSPEAGIIRSYVELFTELPWGKASPETLDVVKARQTSLWSGPGSREGRGLCKCGEKRLNIEAQQGVQCFIFNSDNISAFISSFYPGKCSDTLDKKIFQIDARYASISSSNISSNVTTLL